MIVTLTGMGLSAAAGLNAYIPLLVVALVAKFTPVVTLPPEYAWVTSWWAIAVVTVLLAVEVVVDKVPAVDTVNDAVQTVIRPLSGGLTFAAMQGAEQLDQSAWMAENSWAGILLGVVVALLVHSGKTAARPVANAGSAGVAAPVLSSVEDASSLGLSLAALFAPVIVLLALLVLFGAVVYAWFSLARLRRRRRRRDGARGRFGGAPV
ncbi:DUF4126 domain-containing protein [Dietzia sp. 179-F 9C3 NHS]|uniref:DUF4126 domain-containing protein n=1 Tax=Dietzia sp. 179-F 9C3 NHS TaxID=3374295 RepID=UPI00387A61C4